MALDPPVTAARRVLAAPDKFRGSASAAAVAAAVAAGAARAGWAATELPLADGGEGLLEVVGGETRTAEVSGPLGAPVVAEWRLLDHWTGGWADHWAGGWASGAAGGGAGGWAGGGSDASTAVIEMARASGLGLAGGPEGNDPMRATTRGTGQLIAAAIAAGSLRVVVGCGGSATTDGGAGALEALRELRGPSPLDGVELLVATDVTTAFRDAAAVFGPQKGATPEQIGALTERLAELAERYRAQHGVDVDRLPGAGAAGGLAGGLAVLGGVIVPGFELVASLVGLTEAMQHADALVTGEGRLDASSFAGKVVGGVLARWAEQRPGAPALCLAGEVAAGGSAGGMGAGGMGSGGWGGTSVLSLSERYGRDRSFAETTALVADLVAGWLVGLASRGLPD